MRRVYESKHKRSLRSKGPVDCKGQEAARNINNARSPGAAPRGDRGLAGARRGCAGGQARGQGLPAVQRFKQQQRPGAVPQPQRN